MQPSENRPARRSRREWSPPDLPEAAVRLIRSQVTGIRDDVVTTVREQLPRLELIGRAGDGGLRRVAGRAVGTFVEAICGGRPWDGTQRDFFVQLGRCHAGQLGTLRSLEAACRIGMRVAWQHLSAIGSAGKLPPETVWSLGESAFALVDEIIELIGVGFRETGGPVPDTEQSHREDLLSRLLSDRESDHRGIARAASRAGWSMPARVSVVVLDRIADRDGWTLPVAHPPSILSDLGGAAPCLLVPDPGQWDWLPKVAGTFRGCRMIIGPAVGVTRAARSLEQALEVRDLVRSGLVPAQPVVSCEEHLRALLLIRNRGLVKQLAVRTLAPLEGLGPKKRARCCATLLAWLKSRGNLAEVAGLLHIHPQTVRYRMKELHRLFGDRLEDAGFRLDLELVLRAMDALYADHAGSDTEPPRLRQVLREHGIADLIDDHDEQPLTFPPDQVVSVRGG